MKSKQFEVPGLAQYSYVLSSEGEAIVIDPMRDFDRYTEYAAERVVAIKYLTETHIHADLASGALALAEPWARSLPSALTMEPYRYSMEDHAFTLTTHVQFFAPHIPLWGDENGASR